MISASDLEEVTSQVSNWGRWGDDDELGTLNFITPEKRQAAAQLVRRGVVFSLALPLDEAGPQPPFERRLNPSRVMLEMGTDVAADRQPYPLRGYGFADDMVVMALQAATHWDGLSHVFHNYKMYNGRDCSMVDAEGASANSISVAADRIVTRGLLADFAPEPDAALAPGHAISDEDVVRVLREEGVEAQPGDVLLIRTGHLSASRKRSWERFTNSPAPGLALDALPWLHRQELAAVASDTWAFEVIPQEDGEARFPVQPVHIAAIVYMGLTIGEMFDLDALAADCRDDGRYEFLFCAPPLPFSRAAGAPVNPVAIK
jgi:kynurenine formamidase